MNIWTSFEIPTFEDQLNLPQKEAIQQLRIEDSELGLSADEFCLDHPKLKEMIREYNNKVGTLMMTYTLVYHYFNKGIPDDKWYQSPGTNGQSVQYMPDFKEEHWGRSIWFGYFANVFYLTISSIWDSVLEIINHYYDYDFPSDLRLRSTVLKKIKNDHPDVHAIFVEVQSSPIYEIAQEYRTAAAHGTTPNSVTNTICVERGEAMPFPQYDENGNPILDNEGKQVVQQRKYRKIEFRIGSYTRTNDIFKNMQDYAVFSADKIHEILSKMNTVPF